MIKEALISYLTWEHINKQIKNGNFDELDLKANADVIKKTLYDKSSKALIDCVKKGLADKANSTSHLPEMLDELNWRKDEIDAKCIGATMPEMGDLPLKALMGDINETKEFVKNNQCYKSSQYVEKLTNICDLLDEFPPILIDTNYCNQRNPKDAKQTKYYIEDGNHRAVAYILCGHVKLRAFLGTK